jgi:hypothetical protein
VGTRRAWQASRTSLAFDASLARGFFCHRTPSRVRPVHEASPPLAQSLLGRPYLGVKCGFNDAFVVELLTAGDDVAEVRSADDQRIVIERALLRPLVRGEGLRRWQAPASGDRIIWTHDASGSPLTSLPPLAARWFARWRRELTARTDARRQSRWWSLFRTEASLRPSASRVG